MLHPLLDAPPGTQIHIAAATAALLLGPFAIYRRRRDRLHRCMGYTWIVAMGVVAASSFGITGLALIGPFGPIHLLSLYVFWTLWTGTRHAIVGRISAHQAAFRGLYWHGLWIAGFLTLLPGRRLNAALFPEAPVAAFGAIAAGILAVIAVSRRAPPRITRGAP